MSDGPSVERRLCHMIETCCLCSENRTAILRRRMMANSSPAEADYLDVPRLEAAAAQFIDDMEDKAEVPDRCAPRHPTPLDCSCNGSCTSSCTSLDVSITVS